MRLTIICDAGFTTLPCGRKHRLARCRCECGKEIVTRKYWAESGRTVSCGCAMRTAVAASNKRRATHGLGAHELYHTWYEMYKRCYSPASVNFGGYGARGIRVYEPWHKVEVFIPEILALLGPRPVNHELDRKDNDGDYTPDNVKWSTIKEQAQNRRSNVLVTIDGVTRCISEWARIAGVSHSTIKRRLNRGISGKDLLKKANT